MLDSETGRVHTAQRVFSMSGDSAPAVSAPGRERSTIRARPLVGQPEASSGLRSRRREVRQEAANDQSGSRNITVGSTRGVAAQTVRRGGTRCLRSRPPTTSMISSVRSRSLLPGTRNPGRADCVVSCLSPGSLIQSARPSAARPSPTVAVQPAEK